MDTLEGLREKIRTMRRAGLARGGEHSVENLVFKQLRQRGAIERLSTSARAVYDEIMSLGEAADGVRPSMPNTRAMVEDLEALASWA